MNAHDFVVVLRRTTLDARFCGAELARLLAWVVPRVSLTARSVATPASSGIRARRIHASARQE